ncbi:MAG TPA: chromosome segregation protein SMC, partial [Fimbriimonas sp.]
SPKRKPVGYSEVQLLFDNEDGSLPLTTPEVSVSRRLTRSGESEYRINKRHCRLRDVYELLADSGLGRSGYSIVGQKEIDAALSASAEDRRAWVDEAAGVQRYRARKIESLKRLDSARDHLSRVDDILHELTSQRDPLKEEAEAAARYRSLVGSLREVELGLLVNEVAAAVRETNALEARIAESQKLSNAELERADELEDRVRELGTAISDLESDMDAVRMIQQGGLTEKERAEAELRLCEQRLSSLAETERSLQEDEDTVRSRITDSTSELDRLLDEHRSEQSSLEELSRTFAGVGEAATALNRELREVEKELARARETNARRLKAEAEKNHARERRLLIEREIQGIESALPELEEAIAAAQQSRDEEQAKLESWKQAVLEQEAGRARLLKEEDLDAQTVRRSLAEKASLEGRRRGIEATIDAHEGLTQGARSVMEAAAKGLLQGRYLPVGQAVEAPKELALAVETALGGSANDLIVDDQRDAKEAIEWLKKARAGRATFQPIPLMRPSEPHPELRRLLQDRGVVGRASELVDCEPRVRPVIDSMLGRVVVVQSLDDALRLAKTSGWNRMVTLEGEVVHSSGAVTGGQQARQSYGLVQRKADLARLEDELRELDRAIGKFEERSSVRNGEVQAIENRLQVLRTEQKTLQRNFDEAHAYHQTLADEHRSTVRSRDKLTAESAAIVASTVEIPDRVDLEAIESRRDDTLKRLASKAADAESAEARLREARTRVEQAKARLDAGQKRLRSAEEAERHRAHRLQSLGPERERLRQAMDRHAQERSGAEARCAEADTHLHALQEKRRGLLEDSLRFTEEAKQARSTATAIADGAHQAEVSRARAEARKANSLARLMEDYGLTQEDALEQEGRHEVPPDAGTVVNRLRREIRAMGDVNLGAIEAYERLSQRLEELSAQRDDIVEGMAQVEASIDELDKLTRDRFLSTFALVQQAFSEQFTRLFGGGEGQISLTDPNRVLESGIELDATLPGKRKQALNLLSGGERSLCASAFLFALLSVKPSPLVVLDEVDAPLDGRNVERFAEALFQFTSTTQFIVITHNESTIRTANVHLGVTMQPHDPGVSLLVPVRLPQEEPLAA